VIDEPRDPSTSEPPTGPEANDQQTRESPALSFSPPGGGAGQPAAPPANPPEPAAPVAPPATPPELWSPPARRPASSAPELDKAPRVETVSAPEGSAGDGGWNPERVISVARTLAEEKPEVLVGAAFGGGLLLAIIIRRLGS